MNIFNKISRKFQDLIRFEKLNPVKNFDDDINEIESGNNIDLFKKAISEHEELKEVIWISLYHCLNTFDAQNEYLTVLVEPPRLVGAEDS